MALSVALLALGLATLLTLSPSALALELARPLRALPCGKAGPSGANGTCPAGQYCDPTNPIANTFSRCGTDEKTAWENCASTAKHCSADSDCNGANETCYDDVNCGVGVCSPLMKKGEVRFRSLFGSIPPSPDFSPFTHVFARCLLRTATGTAPVGLTKLPGLEWRACAS